MLPCKRFVWVTLPCTAPPERFVLIFAIHIHSQIRLRNSFIWSAKNSRWHCTKLASPGTLDRTSMLLHHKYDFIWSFVIFDVFYRPHWNGRVDSVHTYDISKLMCTWFLSIVYPNFQVLFHIQIYWNRKNTAFKTISNVYIIHIGVKQKPKKKSNCYQTGAQNMWIRKVKKNTIKGKLYSIFVTRTYFVIKFKTRMWNTEIILDTITADIRSNWHFQSQIWN